MEARDNSFDLDMIHSKPTPTQIPTPTPIPKPYTMHRQYSMQQQAPPPLQLHQSHFQSQSQSRHSAGNLPRQRATSEHWLSSSSFSLSSQGTRPAREHFPLRHQPLSYPQSRPHSYASSSAFSRPAAAYSQHHHSQSATTSFATPPSRHRSPRQDYEWSASTAQAKIDAVTHAIRNKIIVEEDEEDILSTDRFY